MSPNNAKLNLYCTLSRHANGVMEVDEEEESEGRPLTPNQQLTIMKMIGAEQSRILGDPTERDLEVCLPITFLFWYLHLCDIFQFPSPFKVHLT